MMRRPGANRAPQRWRRQYDERGQAAAEYSSAEKIAEMTIQGTTMGVTKTIQHLRDYDGEDESALRLGERLLKIQEENVEEMKRFL